MSKLKRMEMADSSGRRTLLAGSVSLAGLGALAACSPVVRIEAPADPIEINLNVHITQEVRIRVDRELEDVFDANSDIF